MPGRPPKRWFDRCVADVAASGHATDPAAVCGATWRDKSPAEKALTLALEESMTTKKKKAPKHAKRSKTTTRSSKARHTKARRSAHRSAHGKHRKTPTRCPACGHSAHHDGKAGCTHFEGSRFCTCRHRHR
jgi:hypothetical protein